MKRLRKSWQTVIEVLKMSKITIDLGEDEYELFTSFTAPHPKYRIFKKKQLGVALLKLQGTFEEFMAGKEKQVIRTNSSKSKKTGYTFSVVDPLKYIDDIIEIHSSTKERQNQQVNPVYLDKDELKKYFQQFPFVFAVIDGKKKMKAYAHIIYCHDVAIVSRLMGHSDDLKNGIMYYLLSETVGELLYKKKKSEKPTWLMYDTFFGAFGGLRYFKERVGFHPYNVKWKKNED